MLTLLLRRAPAPAPEPTNGHAAPAAGAQLIGLMSRHASAVGRDAAEVRGAIDDMLKMVAAQSGALQALASQVDEVNRAQGRIGEHTRETRQAVEHADRAVAAVGDEVGAIVDTLRQVGDAAGQITQIALQTRLVAFNASVEAKRAGDAGRGFGVVADAVKDLAAKVEASSKQIMGTIGELDQRVAALARDIRSRDVRAGADGGAVHRALNEVQERVARIDDAARESERVCATLSDRMGSLESDTRRTTEQLGATHRRTETFLQVSEQMIESVADGGFETEDTPYIRAAQEAAARIAACLEAALSSGETDLAALFDERYQPVPDSAPAQHLTRFVGLAERWFPPVQEPMLRLSDKVVFCIAADRNGYIACHNRAYNLPQRPGEVVWNTAHCRNRRIFDDRTGLASARNRRPFLLQTYRRDMGGGQFVVMKEVAAPIVVAGRHWGGLRLAYRF